MTCETCKYMEKTKSTYYKLMNWEKTVITEFQCHRYPKIEKISKKHWCGEWQPNEKEEEKIFEKVKELVDFQ